MRILLCEEIIRRRIKMKRMHNSLKRAAAALMAFLIIAPSAVWAAGTEGGSAADPIQARSSSKATIYLSKVLTVSQENKFPVVQDFNFVIENVKAWKNANSSNAQNGTAVAAASMPQPAEKTTSHHSVTRKDGTHTEVVVGDFTGDATTDITDTSTEKYRHTEVDITFTEAGYYMYKITETNPGAAAIPGISYDKNSYYIVVYVCNKTDTAGNTTSGVYVHDITSYRNNSETAYEPNLTDIHKTPDSSTPAAENNYENLSKVGISEDTKGTDPDSGLATGPDKLEAYRFYNDQTTHDVVVTNNVTGNLGDVSKEFEYTVTLAGLEKNKTYTTNVAAQGVTGSGAATSTTADIEAMTTDAGGKGTVNAAEKSFSSDASGKAVFRVKLSDDEAMVFNALPASSTYKIEELASNHVTSYSAVSTSEEWKMTENGSSKANTVNNTALATNTETVDSVSNVTDRDNAEDNDGTVTIRFSNHRDMATVTGIPYYGDFAYVLACLVIVGAIALFIRRRLLWATKEKQD